MPTKIESLEAQVKISKALSHPLRHRVLRALGIGVASPNEIAEALGLELNDIAYHVRRLSELGMIELVDTRRVRGATEHFYRAIHRSMVSTEDWEDMPHAARGPACDEFMQAIVDDYAASRSAGVVGQDKHFHIARTPITVDEEGRDRILDLLEQTRLAMEAELEASLERQRESGGADIRMSFGIATFTMPNAG